SFRWLGPQEARIDVDSPGLAALVVRNSYDPNWHATMDGHPVSLLHVDYVLQGLFVSKGRHAILLRYDDPTIGEGLLGSALVIALLLLAALVASRVRRTRRRAEVRESRDADSDAGPREDRSLAEAP